MLAERPARSSEAAVRAGHLLAQAGDAAEPLGGAARVDAGGQVVALGTLHSQPERVGARGRGGHGGVQPDRHAAVDADVDPARGAEELALALSPLPGRHRCSSTSTRCGPTLRLLRPSFRSA